MTQINELTIRIPGFGDEAMHQQLGNEVAQRVAEVLQESGRSYEIPELKVQMPSPGAMGITAMADAIAEQIIREIKQLTL